METRGSGPAPQPGFNKEEISCLIAALNTVHDTFGTLEHLPDGVMHRVGGLLPETAGKLEERIREMIERGVHDPTVARVMAELDSSDLLGK